MSIDVGRLNKRITFITYTEQTNEYYQTIQVETDYKTVWASVEPVSGREYYEAQRIRSEMTYKIFTRYFPDITQDMLIRYKDRIFRIESVINYREGREMLQFVCTEIRGGNNG